MKYLALMGVMIVVALPHLAQSATDPIFGRWLSENKGAVIEITPCGDRACGRMVWLRNPLDTDGHPKKASNGKPLCGFSLAAGFRRDESGK